MNLVEPKEIAAALEPSLEKFRHAIADTVSFNLQKLSDRLDGATITVSPITIKITLPDEISP